MTVETSIVELARWLQTPPGRLLLAWEQQRLDAAVVDVFGFHALQLGLPELDGLRSNRMPHRWQACEDAQQLAELPSGVKGAVLCEFDELPFETASLDLVLLPHTLELVPDPHRALREVERVLRPEGRLVICGINPASSWGLRQNLGRLFGHLPGRHRPRYLPEAGEFIGYWRLRDWLRLLSFEVQSADFGLYQPPLRSARWLRRWGWIEPVGRHWWPVLGAVYFIVAVKRVHGMRLIGLAKKGRRRRQPQAAVVLNRQRPSKNSAGQP